MRKHLSFALLLPAAVFLVCATAQAQTSTSSSASSSSKTSSFSGAFGDSDQTTERQGQVSDFIVAIIGGMMRHPDPRIRGQAVQSIISGMASGTSNTSGTGSTNNTGGVMNILAPTGTANSSGSSTSSTGTGSTGLGAVIFIPDLYVLLADPDPEIRDIASVGLDVIFNTDMTLMRFMDDPDPFLRRYATKVYAMRSFGGQNRTGNTGSNTNTNQGASNTYELLALRTLLVKLRYEKDPEVRKSITDALDWYIAGGGSYGSTTGGGTSGNQNVAGIFGSSQRMFQYLKDENPEVRKNAVRLLASTDTSENMVEMFMNMLKTEQNEEVKAAIQQALDQLIQKQQYGKDRTGGGTGMLR